MAQDGAFKPDGQLNIPTQAAAGALSDVGAVDYDDYLFAQKHGMPRAQYIAEQGTFEKSMTPTRDRVSLFAQEMGMSPDMAGRVFGGADQGFMDMGLIDIPFVGGAMDAIDAYSRLGKTKEEDIFSDDQERLIQSVPFALKVASVLLPGDNDIKDYYDGKKMDLATLYGGPLGFLGVSSATGSFLSKLARKVDDAPILGNMINKMLPNIKKDPMEKVSFDELAAAKAARPDEAIPVTKHTPIFEKAQKAFRDAIYENE